MAENAQQNFEHAVLEQEMKDLAIEVKKRGLESEGKKALVNVLKEQTAVDAILEKPLAPAPLVKEPINPASPLPGYAQSEPADIKLKIEKLLEVAWHKGVRQAAREAASAGPLVLDAFHDAVIDKLYPELQKRGLLK
ncbi:MAG: hypothetical protein Q8L24_00205 [bacterium]|nr:hypothetical protein [bacterium]